MSKYAILINIMPHSYISLHRHPIIHYKRVSKMPSETQVRDRYAKASIILYLVNEYFE